MTTIQSYNVHNKVAKIIRTFGINAKCVNNKDFDFNNYEVHIKNESEEVVKELTKMMFEIFNNTMINIILC